MAGMTIAQAAGATPAQVEKLSHQVLELACYPATVTSSTGRVHLISAEDRDALERLGDFAEAETKCGKFVADDWGEPVDRHARRPDREVLCGGCF